MLANASNERKESSSAPDSDAGFFHTSLARYLAGDDNLQAELKKEKSLSLFKKWLDSGSIKDIKLKELVVMGDPTHATDLGFSDAYGSNSFNLNDLSNVLRSLEGIVRVFNKGKKDFSEAVQYQNNNFFQSIKNELPRRITAIPVKAFLNIFNYLIIENEKKWLKGEKNNQVLKFSCIDFDIAIAYYVRTQSFRLESAYTPKDYEDFELCQFLAEERGVSVRGSFAKFGKYYGKLPINGTAKVLKKLKENKDAHYAKSGYDKRNDWKKDSRKDKKGRTFQENKSFETKDEKAQNKSEKNYSRASNSNNRSAFPKISVEEFYKLRQTLSNGVCMYFNFHTMGCKRSNCSYKHQCNFCNDPDHAERDCHDSQNNVLKQFMDARKL